VNDSITPITETLSVKIKDFKGTVLKEVSKANSTVGTTASELKLRMPLNEIDAFKNNTVAEISFGKAQALYYFVKPKELKLTNEAIQVTQIATDRSISITLSAETLQKDVFLVADVAGHFSDNFFDLLPGEAKTVQFFPNEKVPTVTYINTLNRIKNNIEGEVPSYSISPID
jgi:beta-mannosidase